MSIDSISFFYRKGRSDKVYHVQIEQEGSGYVVNFQFGRRGSSLQRMTKTEAPVTLDKAKSVYEELIKERIRKDYTLGPSTSSGIVAPSIAAAVAKRDARATGVLPQLLNPVTQEESHLFLDDPAWVMQQKFDGERRLAKVGAKHEITGINRKGEFVELSQAIANELFALNKLHFTIDAEAIDEKLYVFDLLEYRGGDIRDLPFVDRYKYLTDLFADLPQKCAVEVAPLHSGTHSKRAAYDALLRSHAEGVVFKLADSGYVPGRPASGGSAVKVKFWHSASFLVQAVNAKRSVRVGLLDANEAMVSFGNVPIPVNQTIPRPGSILEVRYLYAYEGALAQPTSKGTRNDNSRTDCVMSQLFYKPVESMDEEASLSP